MTVRVLCLFLTVPQVGMQCEIVAFSGHTHLLLFLVVTFMSIILYLDQRFNPLKPNGIFHYYQLEHPISNIRVIGWHFFQIPIEYSVSKQ